MLDLKILNAGEIEEQTSHETLKSKTIKNSTI